MSNQSANDQAKLKKRLEALVKLPDNQTCADCRKRGPRWASANLGIFICIECSGIHRNLGVHISFVRSVNLDSWTKAQVDFMEEWGNGRANEYFEAKVPASVIKPKEGDPVRVVERYIRDKYEHRRYVASSIPPKATVASEEAAEAAPAAAAPRRASTNTTAGTTASRPAARTSTATVPVPVVAPKQETPDLLNMFDEPTQSTAPATSVASAGNFGSSDFGDFTSVSATVAPAATTTQPNTFSAFDSPLRPAASTTAVSNDFMDFMTAPAAPTASQVVNNNSFPPAAPAVPAKPQASADAILSLYTSNMSGHGGPMMGGGGITMMGGQHNMYPTHMGQINAQNPHPPMMHAQQRQMPMGQVPVNPFGQQPHMMQQQPHMMQQQHQQQMVAGRGPVSMQFGGAPPMNPFQGQQAQPFMQQQQQPQFGGMQQGGFHQQQMQQPMGYGGMPQHQQQQQQAFTGFPGAMPGQPQQQQGWNMR